MRLLQAVMTRGWFCHPRNFAPSLWKGSRGNERWLCTRGAIGFQRSLFRERSIVPLKRITAKDKERCVRTGVPLFFGAWFFRTRELRNTEQGLVFSELSGRQEPSEKIMFDFSTLTAIDKNALVHGAEKRSIAPLCELTRFTVKPAKMKKKDKSLFSYWKEHEAWRYIWRGHEKHSCPSY